MSRAFTGVLLVAAALAIAPLSLEAATKKTSTSKKSSAAAKSSTGSKPPAKKTVQEDAAPKTEKKAAEPEEKPKEAEESYETESKAGDRAPNASLEPGDLVEFAAQPPRVQRLIESALALTKRNLTYTYGSADPQKGGMDCSGTIYYTLRQMGLSDVPRDSAGQYVWARKAGTFQAVIGIQPDTFELDAMKPGDLMFWSGTYGVVRDFPVTHVMLYLGREKSTKQRVMFGASDGRSYRGIQRWGVSVFDFKMPRADSGRNPNARFLGYSPIPGFERGGAAMAAAEPPKSETPAAEPQPAVKKTTPAKAGTKSTSSKKKK